MSFRYLNPNSKAMFQLPPKHGFFYRLKPRYSEEFRGCTLFPVGISDVTGEPFERKGTAKHAHDIRHAHSCFELFGSVYCSFHHRFS